MRGCWRCFPRRWTGVHALADLERLIIWIRLSASCAKRVARSIRLFHHGRVLLRDLVHLPDRCIDFVQSDRLFACRGYD
jgi:hypothetical protein